MCYMLRAGFDRDEIAYIDGVFAKYFYNVVTMPKLNQAGDLPAYLEEHPVELFLFNASRLTDEEYEFVLDTVNNHGSKIEAIAFDDKEDFNRLLIGLRHSIRDYLPLPFDEEATIEAIHRGILSLNQISLLDQPRHGKGSHKLEIANQVIIYISKNYCKDFSLDDLASDLHLNASYLSSEFKKAMNMTLTEYLRTYRINKSKTLLTETDLSVGEISDRVGFSDHSYFSQVFKKETNMTPSQYQKKHLPKQA